MPIFFNNVSNILNWIVNVTHYLTIFFLAVFWPLPKACADTCDPITPVEVLLLTEPALVVSGDWLDGAPTPAEPALPLLLCGCVRGHYQ